MVVPASFQYYQHKPLLSMMKIPSIVVLLVVCTTCLIQQSRESDAVRRLRSWQQDMDMDSEAGKKHVEFRQLAQPIQDSMTAKSTTTTSTEDDSSSSELLTWLFTLFYSPPAGEEEIDDEDDEAADYIVEFYDELEDVQGISNEIAETLGKRPTRVFHKLIHGFTISGITKQVADKIASIPQVKSVEKDETVSIDGELRHLETFSAGGGGGPRQEIPWGVESVGGGRIYTGHNKAFIIDTGIDANHPDLNVHPTLCFSAFDDEDCRSDGNGHGTHVSGIIAAIDNNIGVVGVAAGATVVPVKVLKADGTGSISDVIRGIEWVVENGVIGDVCNLSLSGTANESLDEAVRRASLTGIRFVLSAGNTSSDANTRSPSRINNQKILTITAMDVNGNLAWFSNTGKPPIDYVAPGVGIRSTYKNGGYATMDGTSMAAPHVAGAWLFGRPKRKGSKTFDKFGNKYRQFSVKSL
jgi:Subtilase family/Peptidase inhibitor I9